MSPALPSDLELFRTMLRIRRVEEALAERYVQQEMRCPMHLCIGQEAVAAGVCGVLEKRDRVFSNHRAHGHFLAKGGDLKAMIAELYGKATGCCGGRGGSMHLIDLGVGFMGATPIVGGTVPLAVGAAWAAALQGDDRVTVVFFGDGCFEEGVMHESLNFAALHRLPIVFACENNQYSVYTRLEARQPRRAIHALAAAHGLTAASTDGNDVEGVAATAAEAIARARHRDGPQFLEFDVYRWREHCGPNYDDDLGYRSMKEIRDGQADCPVARSKSILAARHSGFAASLERDEAQIAAEISDAFDFALNSAIPEGTDAEERQYA